jgi:acetyl esterase/lipase
MMKTFEMTGLCLLALTCATVARAEAPRTPQPPQAAQQPEPIPLWPGAAPGEKGDIGEEKDTTKDEPNVPPSQRIIRLGNVSRPTITVFRPRKEQDTGAAVVVCPGGGYSILAMDLEGTEVCRWLNSIGVTGVLLKYRVPVRAGLPRHAPPLQDAQRAVGMVRHRAKEWGIDPKRIGILGFSAGGHLAAAASTNHAERTYPAVDAADQTSSRPDFTVLIYPAYLTDREDLTKLAPEIKVDAGTPPAVVVMTADDTVKVENAFTYAAALHRAKVPVSLHVYPVGGHGYGLRPSPNPVSKWPERVAEWLAAGGWLKGRSE